MILEAFGCHLDEQSFFLPLLEGYQCEPGTFVNILGNKFQSHHHQEMGCGPPTPASLYQLAAILIHKGLVRLLDLYPHVSVVCLFVCVCVCVCARARVRACVRVCVCLMTSPPTSVQLAVSDVKLREFYETVMDDAKKTAQKANVVNLMVSRFL